VRATTLTTAILKILPQLCKGSLRYNARSNIAKYTPKSHAASPTAYTSSAFLITSPRTINILQGSDKMLSQKQHQLQKRNIYRHFNLIRRHQFRKLSTSMLTGTENASPQPMQQNNNIPRAAVSVAVRVKCESNNNVNENIVASPLKFYLLIQRGTEPNKGMWSLPGGKIEYHESTFHAAKRELNEETKWKTNVNGTFDDDIDNLLQWYNETVLTTDAIGDGYHFVIAHYFASYPTIHLPKIKTMKNIDNYTNEVRKHFLPIVTASDDALNAQWFTLSEIHNMEVRSATTNGVSRVLQQMELFDRAKIFVFCNN
jgi:ADP-ribose pyrophosphatase YjhB (NUDIX family)